jgi:hypothetical protein
LTDEVKRTASVDPDIAGAVASAYALEGRKDEAFDWLQQSVALGNDNRFWLEHNPSLVTLRDDPRFPALVKGLRSE